MREQFDMLRRGLHIAVATPGRLKDLLGKRKMNLDTCLYLCLDEADRMVDSTGFEEEVREVGGWNRHRFGASLGEFSGPHLLVLPDCRCLILPSGHCSRSHALHVPVDHLVSVTCGPLLAELVPACRS